MNVFDTIYIERNGRVWPMHWKNRHDPTILATVALVGTAVGTGVAVGQTLQQGRQAEKIAERRAQIDIENSEAVRRASVEEARIKTEKGRRLLATQKSRAAAGGIRINVGVPLVIEAQTRAEITADIGFGLERGRTESEFFKSRAALEIAGGRLAKRKSRFQALRLGLQGLQTIAFMGANLPSRTPGTTGQDIRFTGPSAGFGLPTHTGGRLG